MASSLPDRVRDGLTEKRSSAHIQGVIDDVCADIARLAEAATQAHATANDPMAKASDVRDARARHGELKLDQERAEIALKHLQERHKRAVQGEADKAKAEQNEVARKARTAAADRLREVYPRAAMEIIEAIEAVEAAPGAEREAFDHLLNGGCGDVWPLKGVVHLPARLGMKKSISRHGIASK